MSKLAIHHGKPLPFQNPYQSLTDMLFKIAHQYPKNGMRFIDISGAEAFISYAQLLENALSCLHVLEQSGLVPGDIVILIINHDLKCFYTIFWACIIGGIVVAPLSQPTFETGSATLSKFSHIWQILNKPSIIIEDRYSPYFNTLKSSTEFYELHWLTLNDIKHSSKKGTPHIALPKDLSILQFSSGSTGHPKGIQLSHHNILTNLLAMQQSFELTSNDKVFTWLPHTHDMGLFFQYLSPVSTGCDIFIFSPMTFTRSPTLFLKKITEHKGTWFGSPNFGLDWMIKNVSDDEPAIDLSSLRFILNGAEPISSTIMQQFVEKFSKYGLKENRMRAAYGMAEVTVCATVTKSFKPLTVDSVDRHTLINQNKILTPISSSSEKTHFVHVGYPIEEISIRITNKQGQILQENEIGEIQIKGPSVTSGYFNCASLATDLFTDGWLRTGDLGYMRDGSLVIVGRIKDIIFVCGKNYFAHDLEEIIFNKNIVQRGNLLIVGNNNHQTQQEEILVFVKYKANLEAFIELRQRIAESIHSSLGIESTHIIPVKSIPKTTSGKLQRFALLKHYQNGVYDTIISEIHHIIKLRSNKIAHLTSRSNLEQTLCQIWSDILEIPEKSISLNDHFFTLGGNSLKAFQLLDKLSNYLNREIDPVILVSCTTIKQIAAYLEENQPVVTRKYFEQPIQSAKAIAITGMALKFPQADNQQQFWNNLIQKKHTIQKVSSKRKILSQAPEWHDWIGELKNIDYFDNAFFDISDEEARFIDPQQRLIIETAYHALEDAGLIPELDTEQNIGVYSGISMNTYYPLIADYLKEKNIDNFHPHALVGNLCNIISARLSSLFHFTGPSLSLDTACSSFLVALHHAISALRQGVVSGALVTSANILSTPDIHKLSRKAGILSTGKKAKVFDKDANGTVLGEGAVVFYIERLEDAIAKNKHIYGVIRGSAINNDGGSYDIMAPNPNGQYHVLNQAYFDADLLPNNMDYLEVHGTGTVVGDFIEVNTLTKLFSQYTKEKNCIGIGSVKTNIGHLLPAASGAGLAKILLCMQHKQMVPNLHLKKLNPLLKLEESPFYPVNTLSPWRVEKNNTRKAGLSAFGLGGTNAHIVLEEWPNQPVSFASPNRQVLTISAKTPKALKIICEQTKNMLEKQHDLDVHNLCFTRNRYRKHYAYRVAYLISNTTHRIQETFRSNRACSKHPQIGIIIGDLSPQSLNDWHQFLNHLLASTKNIIYILGFGAGENLAGLMNDKREARHSKKTNKLKCDVLIHLGVFKQISLRTYVHKKTKIIALDDSSSLDFDSKLSTLIGELYVYGVDFAWEILHPNGTGTIISLLPYPFEPKSHWISGVTKTGLTQNCEIETKLILNEGDSNDSHATRLCTTLGFELKNNFNEKMASGVSSVNINAVKNKEEV
ncbi:MAG TPA: beta-ketoacyl synthase N-terminal-like domain-containing protein [Legionellaceae bacterium]|nr:beta-ketoacyl synthase N-terminal-like domain-containing protein [Legionellaceae bacterium]